MLFVEAELSLKKNFFNELIYFFLCCLGFSLVAASGSSSLVAMLGLLIVVASLVAEHGF